MDHENFSAATDYGVAVTNNAVSLGDDDAANSEAQVTSVPGTAVRRTVLLLSLKTSAGLHDLPVVGPLIGDDVDVRVDNVLIAVSSDRLDRRASEAVDRVLGELRTDSIRHIPPGLPKGLSVGADIRIGTSRRELFARDTTLHPPIGAGPINQEGTPQGEIVPAGSDVIGAEMWTTVGRAVGPVQLDRIGVAYRSGKLLILVDAGIHSAGLSITATGLGLGIELAEPHRIDARLDGLGLDFNRPPIRIAGALVRQVPAPKPYSLSIAGAAIAELKAVSVSLAGAYLESPSAPPSMFLFGELELGRPIGPPPFQIAGGSLGFGYNSTIRLPRNDDLASFPLLTGFDHDTGVSKQDKSPLDMVRELTGGPKPWIKPASGRMWVAAGISVVSFEFIRGKLMAIADFGGDDFSVALLGNITADFPRTKSTKSIAKKSFARIDLFVQAAYRNSEKSLKIDATIGPGSFLLHPDCVVHGSVAFYTWFAGPHAGDFVLTSGGYHPRFIPPGHYPKNLERTGISWKPNSDTEITGQTYYAITPNAIMAGGNLEVRYRNSVVSAWLIAWVDLLIGWKPFHYDVDIGVRVGGSLRLGGDGPMRVELFAEVGARVQLTGPPTAGSATVEIIGHKFTVRFGDRTPPKTSVSWDEFTEMLGTSGDEIVSIRPLSGQIPPPSGPKTDTTPSKGSPVFSGEGFSLACESAIPVNQIAVTGKPIPETPSISVRPMDIGHLDKSDMTVRLTLGDTQIDAGQLGWQVTPIRTSLPAAMWGPPTDASTEHTKALTHSQADMVVVGVTGVNLTAPSPTVPPGAVNTGTISASALQYEDANQACLLNI